MIKIIVSKELIEKLKVFGLNSYEAKIWTALLSRGVSTAGELSDIANVPRSRTYDILESLEKKGFIVQKIGKPIKYMAIPPEEVIERLKKQVKESAREREKMLEKIKDTDIFEELKLLHSRGIDLVDPSDIATNLKGRSAMVDQIAMMVKESEKYIYIGITPNTLIYMLPRLKPYLQEAKKRGVKINILMAGKTSEDYSFVNNYIEKIAEIRILPDLEARFVVVDDEEALFMLLAENDTHEVFDPGIWVSSKMFSSALARLFELAWKTAKSIEKKGSIKA